MNEPQGPGIEDRIARLGRGMLFAFWIGVAALLTLAFDVFLGDPDNPNRDPVSVRNGDRVEVILKRNRMNHYVTGGTINGRSVEFLLDTGATDVAIPEAEARRLGLERGMRGEVMTANGTAPVYRTRIDRLAVGEIVLRDVRATIVPGMDGRGILLGMSALGQLELRQQGDTLTLSR